MEFSAGRIRLYSSNKILTLCEGPGLEMISLGSFKYLC
jgi:hypothetical protein